MCDKKVIASVLVILFSAHFCIKIYELRDYNIYNGKVIGFEKLLALDHTYSKVGGSESFGVERTIPIVEYYTATDTLQHSEGRRSLSYYLINDESVIYNLGENIRVIQEKNDADEIRLLTLFHYWLYTHELIFIVLMGIIFYGFHKVYMRKKS